MLRMNSESNVAVCNSGTADFYEEIIILFVVFFPFYIVHVTTLCELFVECEAALQVLRSLTFYAHFKIFIQ